MTSIYECKYGVQLQGINVPDAPTRTMSVFADPFLLTNPLQKTVPVKSPSSITFEIGNYVLGVLNGKSPVYWNTPWLDSDWVINPLPTELMTFLNNSVSQAMTSGMVGYASDQLKLFYADANNNMAAYKAVRTIAQVANMYDTVSHPQAFLSDYADLFTQIRLGQSPVRPTQIFALLKSQIKSKANPFPPLPDFDLANEYVGIYRYQASLSA